MAMKNIDSVCLDLLLFLFCFTDIYCWRLYLPVCIPIRSCSFSFGKCLMTKSLTDVLSSNDNLAICDAWSAISVGSPLTTDHSGQSTDHRPQWAVHWLLTTVGSPLTTDHSGQSTDHHVRVANRLHFVDDVAVDWSVAHAAQCQRQLSFTAHFRHVMKNDSDLWAWYSVELLLARALTHTHIYTVTTAVFPGELG